MFNNNEIYSMNISNVIQRHYFYYRLFHLLLFRLLIIKYDTYIPHLLNHCVILFSYLLRFKITTLLIIKYRNVVRCFPLVP